MKNVKSVIDTLLESKQQGSHRGDMAALRRMDNQALQVLAKNGAPLREEWIETWLVVGHLISLGKKPSNTRARCFKKSGVNEGRMRQILGSKSLADAVRRTAGMLELVDYEDFFWSAATWNDPQKRKITQAKWWQNYYGDDNVSDKNED